MKITKVSHRFRANRKGKSGDAWPGALHSEKRGRGRPGDARELSRPRERRGPTKSSPSPREPTFLIGRRHPPPRAAQEVPSLLRHVRLEGGEVGRQGWEAEPRRGGRGSGEGGGPRDGGLRQLRNFRLHRGRGKRRFLHKHNRREHRSARPDRQRSPREVLLEVRLSRGS